MLNMPYSPRAYSTMRVISSIGQWSAVLATGQNPSSAVFPTAKKVLYCPIRLMQPVLVQQLYINNGAAVSGNVEVGLYSYDGKKIVSSGSAAQSGVGVPQLFNITDTQIGAGVFYIAVSLDNTTGAFSRISLVSLPVAVCLDYATETTGSFGLPATATFSATVDLYIPDIGLVVADSL